VAQSVRQSSCLVNDTTQTHITEAGTVPIPLHRSVHIHTVKVSDEVRHDARVFSSIPPGLDEVLEFLANSDAETTEDTTFTSKRVSVRACVLSLLRTVTIE
jgi:hypothetical protein